MSFASVSGSSIGQHLILPFSGNNSGIAMGAQQEVISLPIDKGVWIFNATFSVSTSNLSPVGSTLSAQASVTFGTTILAKHHIDNQLSDDVNLVVTTAWKIAARIGLLHTGYTALTQCATTFSRQISPIILVGRSLTVG